MPELNLDWEFHDEQYKAFLSPAKRIVVRAGRRGGKGVLGARWVWQKALENADMQILVTATTYKQLKDVNLKSLQNEMPADFAEFKRADNEFKCKNGTVILLRSIDNYNALRGLGQFIVGAWFDEFGEYPNHVWDEVLLYTLMDNEAPALFTGTPKGMNKFYELYARAEEGVSNYETYHWTSYDNPYNPREALSEYDRLPEMVKRQEVYGEFLDDLGGVFQGVRNCVGGDYEDPEPQGYYSIGADLGKVQDATVLTALDFRTRHVVYWNRYLGMDWVTQRARIASTSRLYNGGMVWLDATGVGDPVYDELNAEGVPVKPYKFTNESKRKIIENLAIVIGERRVSLPDEPVLINELQIFQAERLPAGSIRYGAPEGYHDDCVISLALGVWGLGSYGPTTSTPKAGGKRTFKSDGRRA